MTTAAATILPETTGGYDLVPIEIGARGTMGNLVKKEIEYFKRVDANNHVDQGKCSIRGSLNPDKKHRGDDGGRSNFWPSFGFLTITWQRVKRKGGGGGSGSGRFLPRMCTMVDVADSRNYNHHRLNEIPSFSYRHLKDEVNQFDV